MSIAPLAASGTADSAATARCGQPLMRAAAPRVLISASREAPNTWPLLAAGHGVRPPLPVGQALDQNVVIDPIQEIEYDAQPSPSFATASIGQPARGRAHI